MPCQAVHPIQDLFLEGFSYVLQIDMHFICTPMWTKFYSCEKLCYKFRAAFRAHHVPQGVIKLQKKEFQDLK
jgi:hypothetical protein